MSDQINVSSLKLIVRTFYDEQDLRKKAFNRIGALQRDIGISEDEANKLTENVFDRIYDVERNLFKDIAVEVHKMPLWNEWLQYVWGIGETLTGALVAEITDISKFDTISKLWAYGGQHPIAILKENGETRRWFPTQDEAEDFAVHMVEREHETAKYWAKKQKKKCEYDPVRKKEDYLRRCAWGIHHEPEWIASRRITGLPDNTNSDLKVAAWKCGQQFLKGNPEKSKYRAYFDEVKAYYLNRDTDGKLFKTKGQKSIYTTKDGKREISAGHINNRALRKTVKLFLCYAEDTQIWTDRGIKLLSQISKDDILATLNPNTLKLEYQNPMEVHCYNYDGDLIHFESESFDFLVTPNHNMFTKSRKGNWHFREARHFADNTSPRQELAEDILRRSAEYPSPYYASQSLGIPESTIRSWQNGGIPRGTDRDSFQFKTDAMWDGTKVDKLYGHDPKLWLHFFGWWLAEGHTYKHPNNSGGYVTGITQKDVGVLETLAKTLGLMGYNPKIYTNRTTPQLIVPNKELYGLMKQFGKSHTKYIPHQIKNLEKPLLEILIKGMMLGDGSHNSEGICVRYSTVSKHLSYDFAEIALKCGYGISFREQLPKEENHKLLYIVKLRRKRITPRICSQPTREPFKGWVYCVTVPNHIIFVGRNGKFAWSGNSHLWVQWRKLEGLPISKPYVIEKMGHQDYIEPFYDLDPDS